MAIAQPSELSQLKPEGPGFDFQQLPALYMYSPFILKCVFIRCTLFYFLRYSAEGKPLSKKAIKKQQKEAEKAKKKAETAARLVCESRGGGGREGREGGRGRGVRGVGREGEETKKRGREGEGEGEGGLSSYCQELNCTHHNACMASQYHTCGRISIATYDPLLHSLFFPGC